MVRIRIRVPAGTVTLCAVALKAVMAVDYAVSLFVFIMMLSLFSRMNVFAFIFFSGAFYVLGEVLSHKIRLVPSFFASLVFAVLAVMLVWHDVSAKLIVAAG